jgi:hypothetical protein
MLTIPLGTGGRWFVHDARNQGGPRMRGPNQETVWICNTILSNGGTNVIAALSGAMTHHGERMRTAQGICDTVNAVIFPEKQ